MSKILINVLNMYIRLKVMKNNIKTAVKLNTIKKVEQKFLPKNDGYINLENAA
jgi:hypothetical protein